MDQIRQDIRHTVRQLARRPGFTLTVVITLGLGIGANSAIFSVVNGVLLTPLPYPEPDRLVGVWHTAPGVGFDELNQSPALHFTYLDKGTAFQELGIWSDGSVSVTSGEEPEQVSVLNVNDGALRALGIQPLLGRVFTAEEDSPGSSETVVLSHGYWQSRFGGDPSAIGRTLRIDGRSMEIIGIMPRGFRFLDIDPSLFLPLRFERSGLYVGDFSYQALARLAPGASLEDANAEIDRLLPVSVVDYPGGFSLGLLQESRFAAALRPLQQDVVGNIDGVLWILLGTAGIVLLIVCANVANLFLVRAEGREREVAVRAAIGASRGRIAAGFLAESVTLGVLGGATGLILALGGLQAIKAMGSGNLPRLHEVTLDASVLLFTLGISIFTGLIFGLSPALKYGRDGFVPALKESGCRSGTGRARLGARNTLVVIQMAMALVLLIGSGLMVRSFHALSRVDPGFRIPDEILSLRLSIPEAEIEELVEVAATHELIARRIAEIPGVTSVGLTSSVTMDGMQNNDAIFVEDFPPADGQLPPIRRFKMVGPNYFTTMQNPVVAGRGISWADIHGRSQVVVVTENFTRDYWDQPSDAVGKRLSSGLGPGAGGWREIVGVVGDIRDNGMSQDPTATVFWPMITPSPWVAGTDDTRPLEGRRDMAYVIRSSRALHGDLLREVRQAIWAVNPNLPLDLVRTMKEIQRTSTARTSFIFLMLATAAAVALVLGSIGVFGVISYAVSQRTGEIGVRIALGAEAGTVATMVLKHGFLLAMAGVAAGVPAAYLMTRLMSSLLFGVSPTDPATIAGVSLGLTSLALLASYLPARRAAATDPAAVLRLD